MKKIWKQFHNCNRLAQPARILAAVVFFLLCQLVFTPSPVSADTITVKGKQGKKPGPNPGSLAWQLDELTNYMVKTRNLVPGKGKNDTPSYILDCLTLSGSVEKNKMTFILTGNVLSDQPVLVPLFGPPERVMLSNVTINGQTAVVGFGGETCYFVKTGLKRFELKGELSLLNEMGFQVNGPVNRFIAKLSDGQVVEGSNLAGMKKTKLHLEVGKQGDAGERIDTPLFQVSRAIRIKKEINFEYRVNVRSSNEISKVELPLRYSETVLDVTGVGGWKVKGKTLLVPASGKQVSFTVSGRLPQAGTFLTDERSNFEWWLIESDPEHRLTVKSTGKPVDPSASPIKRMLATSRLFLLSRHQSISLEVNTLSPVDALAMVIDSQYRKLAWTKTGQLIAEDRVSYSNNGLDYIPFDCGGKPLFLGVDERPTAMLTDSPENKNRILVPLENGNHLFTVQSMFDAKPKWFGGLIHLPSARLSLAVRRSSVNIGVPSGIFPVWLFGGDRVGGPLTLRNMVVLILTLLAVLVFFRGVKLRLAAFVACLGLFLLSSYIYIALGIGVAAFILGGFLIRRIKGWKQWLAFGIVGGAALWLILYMGPFFQLVKLHENMTSHMSVSGSGGIGAIYPDMDLSPELKFEMKYGVGNDYGETSVRESDSQNELVKNNTLKAVIPVYFRLPGVRRIMMVTREFVSTEQPMEVTLLYLTWWGVLPLLLLWLACCAYLVYYYRKELQHAVNGVKKTLQKN